MSNKQEFEYERHTAESPISVVHQDPKRGFLQLVGLSPAVAALAIGTDMLLFAEDVVTMGVLLPLSAIASAALGYCTYRMQRSWGDEHHTAIVKAVIIGLITVIPVPITGVLAAPQALAGLMRNALRK